MSETVSLNKIGVSDIKGDFYVPSYQRGYRWGTEEVERLLNDVWEGAQNTVQKDYLLQPIVISKNGDRLDLVDGQQRLTTLYLIYKYLNSKINSSAPAARYTLTYDTRPETKEYLQNIDPERAEEYIDFYFISKAYETVKAWFGKAQPDALRIFSSYLEEHVKVIWYEVAGDEDDPDSAIALFTRLNIGKIPLTNAELVKAMFLCRDRAGEIGEAKQSEIALSWDTMERELQNDAFFYFLCGKRWADYETRIDLVLDLITEKKAGERQRHYSFFEIDRMRKEKTEGSSLLEIFDRIKLAFYTLKAWYEDHELYHRIGYLIAIDHSMLQKIFKVASTAQKSEFKRYLIELTKKSVETKRPYSDMLYTGESDKKSILTLLTLFNVEAVRLSEGGAHRFPFDKYNSLTWSLEHIHAQRSEGMRTQDAWKKWLSMHIPSVKAVAPKKTKLLDEMRAAAEASVLQSDRFDRLHKKVSELLSSDGDVSTMHTIANLALLEKDDNAALNNSAFDVKRNEIIRMSAEDGRFIPYCTKMAFLKYYTPSEDNQVHFWGEADREGYIEAINKTLAPYLTEKIVYKKED